MATKKRSSRKTGDTGNFGLTNLMATGVSTFPGTMAAPLVIEQPSKDAAPDYRIKSIADIDQKRLQALIEQTYQQGFTGSYSAKLETIGVPQGGSYPLATLTFKAANGVTETFDMGLFLAHPELTWGEMRSIHMLPVVGINFAR